MTRRNTLLLAGLIGTVVSGAIFSEQYGAAVWGRSDIWWTPMELALPLPAASKEGSGLNPLIYNFSFDILFSHYETIYRNKVSALRS
ncbi:MAG: hypothetical protein ACTFAL_08225 [Candidatus Electronema sp. V4]|uniref:hypothetical protein n=1 Tax=Candidatus Electronema sp. V4 TaxID=3454756 RepID=UPI0040557DA6